jgi:tRNA G26 N,N-dimethylase Trm1
MIEMANGWGWIESGKGSGEKSRSKEEISANQKLRELLDIMLEESNPNLQVGYIELDEISKRTKLATPKRACLITALQEVFGSY